MFERFTDRARQVIVLAQDEARLLTHNYIGTEHILLGLLREGEGVAARVLESLDITVERVRAQVVQIVGSGEEVTSGMIPFTPRAKKVLELALREALSLEHNYIATEHILLGLNTENGGVAARILRDAGADVERVRAEVIRLISDPQYRPESGSSQGPSVPLPSVLHGSSASSGGGRSHQLVSAARELPVSRPYGESAWRALELALADALQRGDESVTSEHLLAGLAAAEGTVAQRILAERGLDPDALRAALDDHPER